MPEATSLQIANGYGCSECRKVVEDPRSGLFNGKCWECAMGHNTPAGSVKRLRLAIRTLRMYPQCQFKEEQDGWAALNILEEHVKKLEDIVQPRLEFKDLKLGDRFQLLNPDYPQIYMRLDYNCGHVNCAVLEPAKEAGAGAMILLDTPVKLIKAKPTELTEHVEKLNETITPRLEFVELQPGAIFQFSDHGKFPSTYAENLWLKLAVPVNPGNNGVEMSTGKLGYFGPNTYVRIAGIP